MSEFQEIVGTDPGYAFGFGIFSTLCVIAEFVLYFKLIHCGFPFLKRLIDKFLLWKSNRKNKASE